MARIMLADDAAFMRKVLRDILEKEGHTIVAEAENGVAAVEKYIAFRPDLVILDITMPIMDGLQTVKEIRKIDQQAKILMCSAMGQKRMVLDAIKSGALGFIVKPFKQEKIADEIDSVIKGCKVDIDKEIDNVFIEVSNIVNKKS